MQVDKIDYRTYQPDDDSLVVRQARETHVPEPLFLDVKPILHIAEDILNQAALAIDRIRHVFAFSLFSSFVLVLVLDYLSSKLNGLVLVF